MSEVSEFISRIRFNEDGLVPVITQDSVSKEVLMLAWMNVAAVQLTIDTGRGTYFSRSRNKIWVKGEESGNSQAVKSVRSDCDGDSLLLLVEQRGPACHTGNPTCFFDRGIDA